MLVRPNGFVEASFMFNNTFQKSCRLLDNVDKCRAGQVTDDNIIRRMHLACWIPKATGTHCEYVILISLRRQQWERERASIWREYVHSLSSFNIQPTTSISYTECRSVILTARQLWCNLGCSPEKLSPLQRKNQPLTVKGPKYGWSFWPIAMTQAIVN
jgi:hypothetical protein